MKEEEEGEEKFKDKMIFRKKKRNKSMFSFEITFSKNLKGKQVCTVRSQKFEGGASANGKTESNKMRVRFF